MNVFLTASEACALTAKYAGSESLPYIRAIEYRIREVAVKGQNSFAVWDFVSSCGRPFPSCLTKEEIRLHFVERGFDFSTNDDRKTFISW